MIIDLKWENKSKSEKDFIFIKENEFFNVKGMLETHFDLGRFIPYFIFNRYFFQFPIYYGGEYLLSGTFTA